MDDSCSDNSDLSGYYAQAMAKYTPGNKLLALDRALSMKWDFADSESVLKAAKAFEAYLNGEDAKGSGE